MSRSVILEKLRNQTEADLNQARRRDTVSRRLDAKHVGILPKLPNTKIKRINYFIEKVLKSEASIERVTTTKIADKISKWLRDHNLPNELRMGNDPRLDFLKACKDKLTIKIGPSDGADLVGLSHAAAGVIETGTLVLFSGKENPTTLNFLPENHIIIVNESDLVSHYEEIWVKVRQKFGVGNMPRNLNLITGPSRSADIEQTLLLGAHGPVRLHIFLVRD